MEVQHDFALLKKDARRAFKYCLVEADGTPKSCCALNCVASVVEAVSYAQRLVLLGAQKTGTQRQQIIRDDLLLKTEKGRYPAAGFLLCWQAYCLVRGLSRSSLGRYKAALDEDYARLFRPGEAFDLRVAPHRRTGQVILTQKMANTLRWLLQTAEMHGECSPEDGRVHVLMFLNPSWLHGLMMEWAKRWNVPVVKLRRFMDLFNGASPCCVYVAHLVWKRDVKAKRCGVCVGAMLRRIALVRSGKTKESPEWEECHRVHLRHLQLVGSERQAYMKICKISLGSENLHVLIMDAGHPLRHVRKEIDTETGRSLMQFVSPLLGLIDHTLERSILLTSPANGIPRFSKKGEPTGASWDAADVEVSVLLSYLSWLHEARALRPDLHIQVDGGSTARSYALIAAMALLLSLGWVKRVTISSLIPGEPFCLFFLSFFFFFSFSPFSRTHSLRH